MIYDFLGDIPNALQCPNCHTWVPPMKKSEDGYIKVNWQDIRVLAIYAQRWAATFPTENDDDKKAIVALNKIIAKIAQYRPPTGGDLDPALNAPPVMEAIEDRKIRGIPSPFFRKSP